MKLRQGKTLPSGWDGPTIDTNLDFDELMRERGSEEHDGSDDEGDYDLSEAEDGDDPQPSSYPNPFPHLFTTPSSSPPLASNPSPSTSSSTQSREKRVSHEKRRRKRARMQLAKKPWELTVRPSARRKYVDFARPIKTNLKPASLRITRTGYTAMRDEKGDSTRKRTYRLKDLIGPDSLYNFELYNWDSVTSVPILDKKRRVIAVLAGTPDRKDWLEQHISLADAIEAARPHLKFTAIQKKHRRGVFPA
ncbi:hypothetical protein K523DRAFT_256160, partial [Schizophyllum commune Tattone D]